MQYPVAEIFRSRQGEGFNTGRDVIFVRLAGCNLTCPFCDTDHSAQMRMGAVLILAAIRDLSTTCNSVIITGGEPTIHDIGPLLLVLKAAGLWVGLETNGTNPLPEVGGFDYVSVSPKTGPLVLEAADEVRVAVDGSMSLSRLRAIQVQVDADNYFLSPVHDGDGFDMLRTLELLGAANAPGVMLRPWRLSIQTHKLAGIQ